MAASDSFLKYKSLDVRTQPVPSRYSIFSNNARVWMSIVLMLSDTISLLVAFLIALNIRQGGMDGWTHFFYLNYLWVPIPLLLVMQVYFNLYPGIGLSSVEEIRRLTYSTSLLFVLLVVLTFLMRTTVAYSRVVFVLAWGMTLFFLPINRNLIRSICVKFKMWGEPTGIVGFPDRRVSEIADFFTKNPQKGVLPKAIFVEDPNQCEEKKSYQIVSTDDIYSMSRYLRIKTMLVAVPNWNWVGDNLDNYRYSFPRVILVRPQRDNFSLSDSVALDFNGVMGFQVMHNLLNPWSMFIKRIIDLTISGMALFFLSPVGLAIYLLIRSGSPGPVFYRQKRVGRDGKEFDFLKFRTMYINGDEIFQAKLKEDKTFREEWKKYQKVKSDPRITKIGGFLRKYSLDELPQLLNILRGEMSLVGPRPMMVNQKEMYGPGLHDYCQIRPGVTGLWQISGRNHTTFARRAELDMEYIQRWSLWLDLYIIFKTFKEVVSNEGAY
jgi:Undecaprenyl-phosphate galactose phosphotransferase WbaP